MAEGREVVVVMGEAGAGASSEFPLQVVVEGREVVVIGEAAGASSERPIRCRALQHWGC